MTQLSEDFILSKKEFSLLKFIFIASKICLVLLFILRILYVINNYSLLSTVTRLFVFNLKCAQFTVPVDTMTVKVALLFHRNSTFVHCPFNVHVVSLKMRKRLQRCHYSTAILRFHNLGVFMIVHMYVGLPV